MNLADRVLGDKSSRAAYQKRAWAEALLGAGRAADAVDALEDAREIQRGLSIISSLDTAVIYDLLARADLAQSDFDGAETRAVLGEKERESVPRREERELSISRGVHAEVLRARGDAKGAVTKRREAIDLLVKQLGPEDARVAIARLALAQDLARAGDDAGAMKQLELGGARIEEVLGKGSAHFALFRVERARVLRGRGKHEEALELFDDGWWTLDQAWGSDHPAIGPLLTDRAEASEATGDVETAKRLGGQAVQRCEKRLGSEHPETKRARKLLERLGG